MRSDVPLCLSCTDCVEVVLKRDDVGGEPRVPDNESVNDWENTHVTHVITIIESR